MALRFWSVGRGELQQVTRRSLHGSSAAWQIKVYHEQHPNRAWEPPRSLKYEAPPLPEDMICPGSNWSPPRGGYDYLPFRVFRTVSRQLPVYHNRRGNGQQRTILRRFRGDVNELVRELSKVCDNKQVVIHCGSLEVSGAYRTQIIAWLKRLGF